MIGSKSPGVLSKYQGPYHILTPNLFTFLGSRYAHLVNEVVVFDVKLQNWHPF